MRRRRAIDAMPVFLLAPVYCLLTTFCPHLTFQIVNRLAGRSRRMLSTSSVIWWAS